MDSTLRQRKEVTGHADELTQDTLLLETRSPVKKPSSGRKYCLFGVLLCSIILISLAALFLNTPYEFYPLPYQLPTPPKLEGVLAWNDFLTRGKRILRGAVRGPEHLVFRHGLLYTGTADGKIIEISKDGRIRVVARLGKEPCGGLQNEPTCGRPLGMEFDSDGYLVVCDAYLGIFKVDVTSGEVQELLPSSTLVGGQRLNFLNDLEVTKDGDIYFTDTSKNHARNSHMTDILQGAPAGRLLKFDPIKGESKVVLNNLNFPNGVLLSEFQDYILVSETSRARILKYHIKGINAGLTEVFVDNLPCLPDNLHGDHRTGSVWVACSHVRHGSKFFNIMDLLQGSTWIRRFLMELPVTKLLQYFKPGAMLLEISHEGHILRALMDEGNVVANRLSHVAVDAKGRFYLGSYCDDFIVVLDPKDIPSK